jgi:hypothetical protein
MAHTRYLTGAAPSLAAALQPGGGRHLQGARARDCCVQRRHHEHWRTGGSQRPGSCLAAANCSRPISGCCADMHAACASLGICTAAAAWSVAAGPRCPLLRAEQSLVHSAHSLCMAGAQCGDGDDWTQDRASSVDQQAVHWRLRQRQVSAGRCHCHVPSRPAASSSCHSRSGMVLCLALLGKAVKPACSALERWAGCQLGGRNSADDGPTLTAAPDWAADAPAVNLAAVMPRLTAQRRRPCRPGRQPST